MIRPQHIPLGGGVDGTSPPSEIAAGRLLAGINIESKIGGGYRRILGYEAFDAEIDGVGPTLGVWYFEGDVYAVRNAVGGATAVMHKSTGSGWSVVKGGLAPDGKYKFINYAFSGTAKMYGVSGVHKAFEFDGTAWTDITTGMVDDTPDEITAHKKHLFLSFDNSVQHSSLGLPKTFSAITGAAEILLDSKVTGFSTLPNGAIGIYTDKSIMILAGTSAADWVASNMVEYGNNAGALSGTIQAMGSQVKFADSRGVTDFSAAQVSSDFYDSIVSHDMDKTIQGRWGEAVSSCVVKEKKQYRLFFPDGTGLIFVFYGDRVMISQANFPDPVLNACSTEDEEGKELIFFGSDNGLVYQMEKGNSFGGASITAILDTAFSHLGQRSLIKRFRRMRCDLGTGSGNKKITVVQRLLTGDSMQRKTVSSMSLPEGQAYLGESILGSTTLGSAPLIDGRIALFGRGEWIGFRFYSKSSTEDYWELDGMTIEYLIGRQRR